MRDTIRSIISETFQIPLFDLPENPDPDSIERWDSLGHLKLIARLEEEFNVEIPQDKLFFMTSEEDIFTILNEIAG